jgi:hypothetical protein
MLTGERQRLGSKGSDKNELAGVGKSTGVLASTANSVFVTGLPELLCAEAAWTAKQAHRKNAHHCSKRPKFSIEILFCCSGAPSVHIELDRSIAFATRAVFHHHREFVSTFRQAGLLNKNAHL